MKRERALHILWSGVGNEIGASSESPVDKSIIGIDNKGHNFMLTLRGFMLDGSSHPPEPSVVFWYE